MHYKSFTKRFLYQSEFVVCRVTEITEGENHFFTAGMDLRKSQYAQRFIASGDKWIAKHDEVFYTQGNIKMLPGGITEELLGHLNDEYPINKV